MSRLRYHQRQMNNVFSPSETTPKTIKACGDSLLYIPNFLGQSADSYFNQCVNLDSWRQETISVYGKRHPIPRLTAWYSEAEQIYTYSGIKMVPGKYPDFVRTIADNISSATNLHFNSVLLNKYRDGKDKVGWHRDTEPCLGTVINIATLSLGAPRSFKIKHLKTKDTFDFVLEHGSLLLMVHPFQQNWLHSLPTRLKVKNPRISLTFRKINCLRNFE